MRIHNVAFLLLCIAAGYAADLPVVAIHADDSSKLMWYQAHLQGFPEQKQPGQSGEPWGTQNWSTTEQYMSWDVNVAEASAYEIALLYLCPAASAGTVFEVSAGDSKVTGTMHETGNAWRNPGWDRQELEGTLNLAAGRTTVVLRIIRRTGTVQEIAQVRAIEIVRPIVRRQMARRAAAQRPRTKWMVEAKYGLMTHWTPFTQPRRGPKKLYCEAVRDFDVVRYTRMFDETGAGYVVFTTGWGGFWFPAPIRAINDRKPGHGCERDLIMDLANALAKRNRKLILYWGWSPGRDYAEAWGKDRQSLRRICRVFSRRSGNDTEQKSPASSSTADMRAACTRIPSPTRW